MSGNTGEYSRARSRLPYNLVRAAIYAAAQAANLNPRQISFSRAQDVVNACLPNLLAARSEHEHAIQLDAMLRRIAQCKLPRTSHRPSYPRMVWPRSVAFPKRKSGEHHAPKNSHD